MWPLSRRTWQAMCDAVADQLRLNGDIPRDSTFAMCLLLHEGTKYFYNGPDVRITLEALSNRLTSMSEEILAGRFATMIIATAPPVRITRMNAKVAWGLFGVVFGGRK
jgi:hypothetical protein